MGQPAFSKNTKQKPNSQADSANKEKNVTTEGLEDFFVADLPVADQTAKMMPTEAVPITSKPAVKYSGSVAILTEKQVCKELDISKRVLKLRLAKGMYKTFPGTDGKERIILPIRKVKKAKKEKILDFKPSTDENGLDASVVEPETAKNLAVPSAKDSINKDGAIVEDLVSLVDRLNKEAVTAAEKIGYLEGELCFSKEQLKELPDLRIKAQQASEFEGENRLMRQQIQELKIALERAQEPIWGRFWRKLNGLFGR